MKSCYLAGLGLVGAVVVSCSSTDGSSVLCGRDTVLQDNRCLARGGAANTAGSGNSSGKGAGGYSGHSSDHDNAGSAGESLEAGMGGEPNHVDGSAGDGGARDYNAGGSGADGSNAGNGSAGTGGSNAGNGGSNADNGGTAGGGPDQSGLVTSPLDCGSRDVTGATVLTQPITQDATWSGVVHLPNGLRVRNEPTLTIAPGTKIIVGHNASVEFGYLGSHATIVAKGTIDKPIKFCGETDTAGYWNGLVFGAGIKNASVLRNVLIADGGATDAGLTLDMSLLVQGVQVRNSGANGVNAVGFAPSSSALLVSGATKLALKATGPKGVEVPAGSQLTGNGTDIVDIAFASFDTDLTFRDLGVPYRQLADLRLTTPATTPVVTFEPGAMYQIARQKVLDLGNATVHALGSTAKPIVFQRLPCPGTPQCDETIPATADAGGRIVANGLDLRFENVELRRFGWVTQTDKYQVVTGALTVGGTGTLKVDHLKLTGAVGYGLKFTGTATFSPDSSNLEVEMMRPYVALGLGCAQATSLPLSTQVSTVQAGTTNTTTTVDCDSIGKPAIIWPAGASPYVLGGSLTITSGSSLTLEPAVSISTPLNAVLTVQSGGTLKAIGTSTAKIGLLTAIVANSGSDLQLDYTSVVLNRASTTGVAITAYTPILLAHSLISYSGTGLKKLASDTTDYVTGNTFSGSPGPDITDLP